MGDIRGGLTISVPMESVLAMQTEETIRRILGFGGMWLLGLCGIAVMSRHLRQQVSHRYEAEQRLREAHDLLEKRVAERTAELAEVNRKLQDEIVDRKQAEQWLLESEQRFRSYFEQGLVGMAILSAEKRMGRGQPSPVRHARLHRRRIGAEGLGPNHLSPTISLPWSVSSSSFSTAPPAASSIEARLLRKDGRAFPAGLSAQCLKKPDGKTDCLLVLVQDMTHRQRPWSATE